MQHVCHRALKSGTGRRERLRRASTSFENFSTIVWDSSWLVSEGNFIGETLKVLVGYTARPCEVRLSNLMAGDAIARGNLGCLPEHYPAVVDLALAGRIALDAFITPRPMQEINEVFEQLHHGSTRGRIVLIPEAQA